MTKSYVDPAVEAERALDDLSAYFGGIIRDLEHTIEGGDSNCPGVSEDAVRLCIEAAKPSLGMALYAAVSLMKMAHASHAVPK